MGYYRTTSQGGSFASFLGSVIMLCLIGLGLYCVVGAAWRHTQLGVRGVDVIPHAHFWRQLPERVVELSAGAAAEVRGLVEGVVSTGVPVGLESEGPSDGAGAPLLRRR